MEAGFFLENSKKKKSTVVCRQEDRKVWTSDNDKIYFELLNPSLRSKKFEVVYVRLEPFEASSGKYTHEGEEFGLVLKGQIRVEVGDDVNVLKKGDSIYFKSTIPHAIHGVDSMGAEVIWVNAPPIKIL